MTKETKLLNRIDKVHVLSYIILLFLGWKLPSSLSVCGLIFALFGEGLLLFGLSKEQKKWKKKQKEEGDTPQIKITCANNWLIGECGCQVNNHNARSFEIEKDQN